jgi:hypothetical protein
MGCFSNVRYEVHHKQTEEDLAFWNLAKQLIKSYKKETSFMALHDDHPELGARGGGGPGQDHNTNHYHSEAQLERHRKMGQELLRLGCGKRMANIFIEELQYSDAVVLPSNATGLPHAERTSSNVTVKRLVSLEKFHSVVLRDLIANSFNTGNRHKHGYEATTATAAIHNAGAVTVLESGRTSDDIAAVSENPAGDGAGPRVHFSGSVSAAPPPPAEHYLEEDVAYYSNHVMNHEGGGWNNIVNKMKGYQGGHGTKAARQYVSAKGDHVAASLRPTETVLMSVIQNTLNARKMVELQLAELQSDRGWNLPHAPPPS